MLSGDRIFKNQDWFAGFYPFSYYLDIIYNFLEYYVLDSQDMPVKKLNFYDSIFLY